MHKHFFSLLVLLSLAACQTPGHRERAPAGASCPSDLGVGLQDLKNVSAQPVDQAGALGKEGILDLSNYKGKVVIFRVIGTWCPYCKGDLMKLYDRYLSHTELRSAVEVVLLSYKSESENPETVGGFRTKVAERWGRDPQQFQFWYAPEGSFKNGFEYLRLALDSAGRLLFPDIRGVPYAMVFDQVGRLRLRGHFTSSPDLQADHYAAIDAILAGCSP